jgi:DNA repair and recombination protein RAD54B
MILQPLSSGASRLCLIDSDWNPRYVTHILQSSGTNLAQSHDLQSTARCHRWAYLFSFVIVSDVPEERDGQKRPVYIYRFLTAGTIDGMLSNKLKPDLLMLSIT